MNANNTLLEPVRSYLSALAATAETEAPYGAVIFTMLTTLTPLHDLLSPTTLVRRGRLSVAARLGQSGKEIPVPGHTLDVLGGPAAEGTVSGCLGIQSEALPPFRQILQLHLLNHDALNALPKPEQIWSASVHALMTAAGSAEQRLAVLSYAGISAADAGAERRGRVTQSSADEVASLIHALVINAGFGRTTRLVPA